MITAPPVRLPHRPHAGNHRLADLRSQLAGMLAAIPGPACPDPLPGTWRPSHRPTPKEVTRGVLP